MSVLMEFAIFPTDKGASVSPYVSKVINMIQKSGVNYKLTAMGTIIETENIEEALNIIKEAYKVLDNLGCERIYSSLKFDIRKHQSNRLEGKIKSVENKIGKVKT